MNIALVSQSRRAFNKLWRLTGGPTLRLIEPISAWTLGSGVTYSAHQDAFLNDSGVAVDVAWSSQPCVIVPFLPDKQNRNVQLEMTGVMATVGMNVVILWDVIVQHKVELCWGVGVGGKLYRVDKWEARPAGVVTPTQIALSLVDT